MIKIKIHKVIEGPMECPEFEGRWINLCLCEIEGETDLVVDEVYFEDFEDARAMYDQLQTTIDPIVISMPTEEDFLKITES
jgi:hypothetical protein